MSARKPTRCACGCGRRVTAKGRSRLRGGLSDQCYKNRSTAITNPWAGRLPCPTCGLDDWTLPWDERALPGFWRCVRCHESFHAPGYEREAAG